MASLRLLLLGLLMLSAGLYAAEEEAPAEDPETETADATPVDDPLESGAAPPAGNSDEPPVVAEGDASEPFIPSEQISEDFSVSFPVDI